MYKVNKIDRPITGIHDEMWDRAEVADVMTVNWIKPGYDYLPTTTARMVYSDVGLHVKMTTDERPLRAYTSQQNGNVYEDSCMEFFISPQASDPRYINFEINPIGTMYISLRYDRYNFEFLHENSEFFGIVSEITPTSWTLCYTVPFSFLDGIFGGHSQTMRGNFYKCGDETGHPHLASYFPVKTEKSDFHVPSTFGEFVLE